MNIQIVLNALNFLLADVRDGLGPFLGVFLQSHHWSVELIGSVTTIGGLAGVFLTFPIGIMIDIVRCKRLIIIIASMFIAVAIALIFLNPTFKITAFAQIMIALGAAAIPPAINAITLGIVGQKGFDYQLGRNEAFNHLGNSFSAVMSGLLSLYYKLFSVFLLNIFLAIAAIGCTLLIPFRKINYAQSRGASTDTDIKTASFWDIIQNQNMLVFCITVTLFHLANAAMLPLLGQSMMAKHLITNPGLYTAITIIVAQVTMIPAALLASSYAKIHGYYLVFILAIIVLPVRGLLAGLFQIPIILLPVQILDGIGAGLMGVAVPGLAARLLFGSGRFNAGFSFILTMQGIGAALSHGLAGYIAKYWGYNDSFIVLSIIALLALLCWVFFYKTNKSVHYNIRN